MYTKRRVLARLALPFGLVTLATLGLFLIADQTLDALSTALHLSDLWMEADRSGALQVERCLDSGGMDCDRLPERLKRPLAYLRAARERAKPNPDPQVIREALAEAGTKSDTLLRFLFRWFERVSAWIGLETGSATAKENRAARATGDYTPDIRQLFELNARAKLARNQQPVNPVLIASIRRDLEAFRVQEEISKTEFDKRAAAASDRLRQFLYVIVVGSVLAMFGIATWISRGILKRWAEKEEVFLARDRELSQALQLQVEELQHLVNDKGVLLRELQHRVKNSLQVVSSLASLQARQPGNGAARASLLTIQDRVKSLALIHESLCFSDSLAQVNFAKYAQRLSQQLVSTYNTEAQTIQLHVEASATIALDQSTPCALILNELLSNALKHAFPDRRPGDVWVTFVQHDQSVLLEVRDNGIGIPPGYSIESSDSLGLQLVSELAEQLHGTFTFENDGGAVFRVQFQARTAGRLERQTAEAATPVQNRVRS